MRCLPESGIGYIVDFKKFRAPPPHSRIALKRTGQAAALTSIFFAGFAISFWDDFADRQVKVLAVELAQDRTLSS